MLSPRNPKEEINERKVASIVPDATVFDALQIMAEHDFGSVLVLEGEDLAGI